MTSSGAPRRRVKDPWSRNGRSMRSVAYSLYSIEYAVLTSYGPVGHGFGALALPKFRFTTSEWNGSIN